MSIIKVKDYLSKFGLENEILEMDESTATVQLAAEALGTIPAKIAKTIALKGKDQCIILVSAGDARLDNRKFKDEFQVKAKMLSFDETSELTGHKVGGVCPFALPEGMEVVLDISLKRFDFVYPACGSANSAIKLTIPQLEETVPPHRWVDVSKDWDENLT